MIKTQELMLGNLVECDGKYCTIETISRDYVIVKYNEDLCHASPTDINPIELTDEIKRKLVDGGGCFYYLHNRQNWHTVFGYKTLDITPLLKPKPILTTHDKAEINDNQEMIWIAYQDATNLYDPKFKDAPCQKRVSTFLMEQYSKPVLVFSTLDACINYINTKWAELHPEPIFVTEDGVNKFKGDFFWYCRKSGYYANGVKSEIKIANAYEGYKCGEEAKVFSNPAITQAYLNKVWAETEYNNLLKTKSCQNK